MIGDGLAADAAAATALVASQSASEIAAYMRGKSADAIWTTMVTKLAPVGAGGSGPIPDGYVLPESPIAAIKAGRYVKGPMLVGNTRDEGTLFPALLPIVGGSVGRLLNDATVFSTAYNYDPNAAPATKIEEWIPASYLPADTPGSGFTAKTADLTRVFFLASRDSVLNALQTQQSNIWYYRFDWDLLPPPFDVVYGASHAFDLPFAFGNFGPSLYANISYTRDNEPGRVALSDAMMQSIGAFARRGDPNHPALGVTWPTWPSTLLFDASATATAISVVSST
jgi:carboxylesterase type B